MTPEGTSFVLSYHGRDLPLRTRLLGRFNVQNWLAAAGAALACGAPEEALARAAALVPPPPGRLEPVDAGQPFGVYVDFAHTPQGLGASLETLRELHQGRVIAVFGHAGERDTDHRRGLVEVARGHCDLFILTMDDPYSEDPAAILEKMRSAALSLGLREGRDFLAILDRRAAFAEALQQARPGDAVLLAGRGHETYIPIGGERIPFQDAIVARELLSVS